MIQYKIEYHQEQDGDNDGMTDGPPARLAKGARPMDARPPADHERSQFGTRQSCPTRPSLSEMKGVGRRVHRARVCRHAVGEGRTSGTE